MSHQPSQISPQMALQLLEELAEEGGNLIGGDDEDEDDVLAAEDCRSWHNRVLGVLLLALGEIHDVHVFSDISEEYPPFDGNERRERIAALRRMQVLQRAISQLSHCRMLLAAMVDTAAESSPASNALDVIGQICTNFHRAVRQLRHRREGRPTIDVSDEYDVQDLVHALLRIHFDDVRPEEYSPSYAGGASRVDFLLPEEEIVIEIKKTRPGLNDRQIGEQLIIDQARYAAHPHCRVLVCFIYDPEHRVTNPEGIRRDLEQHSPGPSTRVFISPR